MAQAAQRGAWDEAAQLSAVLRRSAPARLEGWFYGGAAALAQSRPGEAAALLARAVELAPRNPDLLTHWGAALSACGDAPGAEAAFARALEANSNHEAALLNWGNLHRAQGRLESAQACYERAAQAAPQSPLGPYNLSITLRDAGCLAAAQEALERALARAPEHRQSLLAWGGMAAARASDEALPPALAELARRDVEAALIVGNLHLARSQWSAAEEALRTALELDPKHPQAHNNLGNALRQSGRLEAARACYAQAVTLEIGYADAWNNLGLLLREMNQPSQALACYEQALKADPQHAEALLNRVFALDLTESESVARLQAARRDWAAIHGDPWMARWPHHANDRNPERPLRIGYLSADLRRHSAAFVFASLFLHHDPEQFTLIAYAGNAQRDEISQRLAACCADWVEAWRLDDDALAQRIQDDRIDILVDLSGHSRGRRLGVLARKPAPVQMSGWGYPGGTGLRAVDWLLADPEWLPAAPRAHYAERIADLPCVLHLSDLEPMPDPAPPPCVLNGHITFGAFHRAVKNTPECYALWARLLRLAPTAHLLFKGPDWESEPLRQQVSDLFAAQRIDPARLDFLGGGDRQSHLRALGRVDILLDAFPQNGGVGVMEALRMGVPVAALRGAVPFSRTSASLLRALGREAWIADDADAYVDIARRLASDIKLLARERHLLRPAFDASPLGDGPAYVRAAQAHYRRAWRVWAHSRPLQG
ncbi:putative SPINDLY family O-linked N-acetylglucosamine transferase [Magnetofaba australis IT-1]|uniref:protein O-GlcNAc transferase n=1 Tax=Magnetofaba australis IT-1 TaxID=1434232 RepID=A0A1Y2K6Q1_9PROT|nr:putative SPINDLY family O-linked N-acetylglucosamine transferase [Magnetofaba australis IT-1]